MNLFQLLTSPTKFQNYIHEQMKLLSYKQISEMKETIRNKEYNFVNEVGMAITSMGRGFLRQNQSFQSLQKDYPEIFRAMEVVNPDLLIRSFRSFTSIAQNETNVIIEFSPENKPDFLQIKRILNSNTNIKDVVVKNNRMLVTLEGILKEAKFERKTRVRGGQIQRRKKVSTDKNFDASGRRITAKERRNRKLAQKKAAKKRKSKQGSINRQRKKSERIRSRIGA